MISLIKNIGSPDKMEKEIVIADQSINSQVPHAIILYQMEKGTQTFLIKNIVANVAMILRAVEF